MSKIEIDRGLAEAIARGRPDGRYHNGWFLCGFCTSHQEDGHDYDCPIVALRRMVHEETNESKT